MSAERCPANFPLAIQKYRTLVKFHEDVVEVFEKKRLTSPEIKLSVSISLHIKINTR
jgi:hypothetical protein